MFFSKFFTDVPDTVGEVIHEIQSCTDPLVLYGAGYCCPMVLELCEMAGLKVRLIIDSNPAKYGESVHTVSVVSYETAVERLGVFQVLISTSHFDEITKILRERGFSGEINHLPMNAYYKNAVFDKQYIQKHEKEFSDVYEQLADETSRRVFLAVMKQTISLDNRYFEDVADVESRGYFGTELFRNTAHEIIVDGGAFDGDTIREFESIPGLRFDHYYAFEPDRKNYELLYCNVKNNRRVTPICAGIGEKCETLHFTENGTVSSRVDDEGTGLVEIVSIDSRFSEIPVTFIKMDIEGSEYSALLGGRETIRNFLPTLAICAYHKRDDLFRLPELINSISDRRYSLFIRHTFYYQTVNIQPDVIIYAVAKKNESVINNLHSV